MKRILVFTILALPLVFASLPIQAKAAEVVPTNTVKVKPTITASYEVARWVRVWVPGHWRYNRYGSRYWVHGYWRRRWARA